MKVRKSKQQKQLERLDQLMCLMASDEVYDEYIIVRGKMNNASSI